MKEGKTYLQAVKELWNEIPNDDKALLYRPDFDWVSPEEAKTLQALGRFGKVKDMI